MTVFRSLCSRCGAVIERQVGADSGPMIGQCPECGLGWSSTPLVAVRPRRRFLRRRPSPATGAPEDRRKLAAAVIVDWPLPLYGLDESWEGRRWIGGHGSAQGRTTEITLAHGNAWADDAPLIRVETAAILGGSIEAAFAARKLANFLLQATPTPLPAFKSTYRSDVPTGSWDKVVIDVDGQPAQFHSLASGPSWVALRQEATCLISIEARHIDTGCVHLVPIFDPERYLVDDGGPR